MQLVERAVCTTLFGHGLELWGVIFLGLVLGSVVKLQIIVHLHLLGIEVGIEVSETLFELIDRQVDVAIVEILSIGNGSQVGRGPLRTITTVSSNVSVFAPRVAGLDQFGLVREDNSASNCVGVA